MLKKVAKKARAKQKKTKIGVQKAGSKADDPAVKEYREKYEAWEDTAPKMLAAKELMKLTGGYKEAFVLLDTVLDVVMFPVAEEMEAGVRKAGGKADDRASKEYGEKNGGCAKTQLARYWRRRRLGKTGRRT